MKIWFLDHLQGRLPLGRVFWLHGMALRLLMYASLSAIGWSTRPWFWFLIPLLLLDLGLFVWQLIGFSRSGDAYVRRLGNVAFIWGGYSAFALTAVFSLILWWGLILSALPTPEGELFTEKMDRLHRSAYQLQISEDGTRLKIQGEITFGFSNNFLQALKDHPGLKTIVLNSQGGHIYEARGAARSIQDNGLNTHASRECSSACTLLFVAGRKRSLAPEAKIGFHQYALSFGNSLPNLDLQKEQEKDRAFFQSQGVKLPFLKRMFQHSSKTLWYPEYQELIDSGFLNSPN